ncbi:MAG TPA: universal stress protein [Verrucomicrobiae bacterium]
MKRILIAYDGTTGAEIAIKDMTRAGFGDRDEAKVVSFADVWLPPAPDIESPDRARFESAHQNATELLREAQQIAVAGARLVHSTFPNWTVSNVAKADSPAWGIIAEARNWPADLVVIGSHGRTPLERFFLGSVSAKVTAEAPCSVRIVRPHEHVHAPPVIVIAVDGSADAQIAVEESLSRKWKAGTEIHLVTIVDPKLRTAVLRRGSTATLQRIEDFIGPVLEDFRGKFSALGVKAETHILEGEPKATLLSQAAKWKADAIFLGARGLEHGNRLYLGTLASAISSRAHCSVEIVRPPPKMS